MFAFRPIKDNQRDIRNNQKLMKINQEDLKLNQALMFDNQALLLQNQNLMAEKLNTISEKIFQKFKILVDNDKAIIKNKVSMILLQNFAIDNIQQMSQDLDTIEPKIRLNQYISEYGDATREMKNVFNKFDQTPRGPFGSLKDSPQFKWFVEAALDPITGLNSSTAQILAMLKGGGIWHNGKSVFEVFLEFGCQEETLNHFTKSLEKAQLLFKIAMKYENGTTQPYEKLWIQDTAKAYEAYSIHCGCPPGLKLEKTGQLSELLRLIKPNAIRNFTENIIQVNQLHEDYALRDKAQKVLKIQNFDVSPTSVEFLNKYWNEDLIMVDNLHQSNLMKYLSLYDGLQKCIDPLANSGVTLTTNPICSEPGFCQVSTDNFCVKVQPYTIRVFNQFIIAGKVYWYWKYGGMLKDGKLQLGILC